jgi:acetylornithine deacetylase
VDPVAQIALTRQLIDIDSTTGREADVGRVLASTLRALGYHVTEQHVVDGRFNVIAHRENPVVVMSTHMDCVPPFFPSRVEGGRLYGRGACDVKGAIVAMIAAAERLHAAGESRVGLLFVIAEERGSEGARAANQTPIGSRFLIDGEPTDNRLGIATRGVYRAKLKATGRAAHSSQPELGESAIDKLIDALVAMRRIDWPSDPDMGRTFYSVGLVSGGVAPNVISPSAEAEVMFRTVGDFETLRGLMTTHLGSWVSVEDVLVVPPVRLRTAPGFERA